MISLAGMVDGLAGKVDSVLGRVNVFARPVQNPACCTCRGWPSAGQGTWIRVLNDPVSRVNGLAGMASSPAGTGNSLTSTPNRACKTRWAGAGTAGPKVLNNAVGRGGGSGR